MAVERLMEADRLWARWARARRELWDILLWLPRWFWALFCLVAELVFGPLVALGRILADPGGVMRDPTDDDR